MDRRGDVVDDGVIDVEVQPADAHRTAGIGRCSTDGS
jgi:hypothetical protein